MKLIEIQALNFMRFHKIQLFKIPAKGLFCIQGENESGKSTIGTLLFFAFAGVGPKGEQAEELINWEKGQLKLKVTFKLNGKIYQLMRQVDRDGSNFSRLVSNDQTIARGNTPILEAMAKLCQYKPRELDRSFLITHRIIQKFATEPRMDHLDYMLNLDPLKDLSKQAREKEEELIQTLETHQQTQGKLNEDKVNTGFDADKQNDFIKTLEDQNEKKVALEQQLQSLQDQQTGLQSIQDQLSEGSKQLPSKFGDDAPAELEQLAPNLVEKFSQLHVVDKTKECLLQSNELLEELHAYLKQSKTLHGEYEGHLSKLKNQLGNSKNPNEASLCGKTQKAETKLKSSLKAKKFWIFSSVISLLSFVATIAAIVLRPKIVEAIKGTPIYEMIDDGSLTPMTMKLREILIPSSFGIPLDPRFLISMGAFFAVVILSILMVMFYRKKSSQLKETHEQALKSQDHLQQIYSQLLSADFKDMSEVGSIIEESDNDELIELYHQLKSEHPTIASEKFKLEPVVRFVKDHIEEAQQNLSLDMHKLHNQLEEREKELSKLVEDLNTTESNVKDMQNRKEQFEGIVEKIKELTKTIQKDKDECATQRGLAELSSGTVQHIRHRFQRELTGLYKELMPQLTEERYGAVRVSDDYKLEVFSEERGDFVPLRSLSSGTNDLFNLVFQIVLLQAFLESRALKEHYVFLDEPLLAVDKFRYQRLTELLPSLSEGLGQIFLCRPPQTLEGAMLIETSLDAKDLIVDFSKLEITA